MCGCGCGHACFVAIFILCAYIKQDINAIPLFPENGAAMKRLSSEAITQQKSLWNYTPYSNTVAMRVDALAQRFLNRAFTLRLLWETRFLVSINAFLRHSIYSPTICGQRCDFRVPSADERGMVMRWNFNFTYQIPEWVEIKKCISQATV